MATTEEAVRTYHWDDEVIHGEVALGERLDEAWRAIQARLDEVHAIAWDTCHKVYVSFTREQTDVFRQYGYGDSGEGLVLAEHVTREQLLQTLIDWYEESCPLKFVGGWSGDHVNAEYESLIPQIFVD